MKNNQKLNITLIPTEEMKADGRNRRKFATANNRGDAYELAIAYLLKIYNDRRFPFAPYTEKPDMVAPNGDRIQCKAKDGTAGYQPNMENGLMAELEKWLKLENSTHLAMQVAPSKKAPNLTVYIEIDEFLAIVEKFDIADLVVRFDNSRKTFRPKMAFSTARKYFEKFIIEHPEIEIVE